MSREAIESFVEEIRDALPKLRRAFAVMHACPDDPDAPVEAHRLTHSIKGTAALVGLAKLSQIADQQEQLLERVLDGRWTVDDSLRDTLERLTDIAESFADGLLTGALPEDRWLAEAVALARQHLATSADGIPAFGTSHPTAALPVEPTANDDPLDVSHAPSEHDEAADSTTQSAVLDEVPTTPLLVRGLTELSATDVFRIEAAGSLRGLGERLAAYRDDLTRWDILADVRRRFASLKQAAAAAELADFAELTRHAEDLMQQVLDRRLPPTELIADCLQACVDALDERLERPLEASLLQLLHEHIDQLAGVESRETLPADEPAVVAPPPDTTEPADVAQEVVAAVPLEMSAPEFAASPADAVPSPAPASIAPAVRVPTAPESIELDDRTQLSEEMLEVFREEAEDHLRLIDAAFAELEKNPARMSSLQDVRRSAHTIKGAAGSVGLRLVSKLAHRLEDLLDWLFAAQQPITTSTLALLYDTTDALQDLVQGNFAPDGMRVTVAQLYDSFDARLAGGDSGHEPKAVSSELESATNAATEAQLRLRTPTSLGQVFIGTQEDVCASGPKGRHSKAQGEATEGSDALGPNDENDGSPARAKLDDSALSGLTISPLEDPERRGSAQADPLCPGLPGGGLSGQSAETQLSVDQVPVVEQPPSIEPIPPNELVVDDFLPMLAAWNRLAEPVSVPPPQSASALADSDARKRPGDSLRVPLARIESLMREVGELIINRSAFEQGMSDFARCVEELQRAAARLRNTAHELDVKYGVGALGGRRRVWGDGAALLPGTRRLGHSTSDEFDALEFDRYTEFHLLSRSLTESTTDLGALGNELRTLLGDFDQLLNRQGRLSRDTQDPLMRIRMVPLATLASKLHRTVRTVAAEQHKDVEFLLQGGDTELDKLVLEELADPLLHLLRNAVDHGLETADVRRAANKPERATIRILAFAQGTQVVLRISDDGAGLNFAAIRETATRHGLASAADVAKLTAAELAAFIFLPGFSTAREVSEVSGRGIGMDIVRDKVQRLKGTISVESLAGQGTTFTIRLPMMLAVTRALLVHAATEVFALPMPSVVQILRLEREQIDHLGPSPTIRLGEESLPLVYLAEELRLKRSSDKCSATLPVLIVASGDHKLAVGVDKVLPGRDIVVKTLGSHLRKVKGLLGATLLGDGSVVPILDTADLVSTATAPVDRLPTIPGPHRAVRRDESPTIMVVDDSVSVRRVMSNLLQNAGWTVLEAKDGIDALDKLPLAEERPRLFLLDIEMPRMDGYQLLATLRSQAEHHDTPIVMVTSRAGDKHRQKAMQLGATDYVVKPYQDDELLSLIRRLLAGREAVLS
jgi:chemosensory pili system protein ChpA (sensor histidine kinase/response regulator)